jgi:hypothetical protein
MVGLGPSVLDVVLDADAIEDVRTESGNSVRRRNSTTIASSAGVRTVLLTALGPIGASAVSALPRHSATVFGFSP